ncbi:MAG TPA: peptidylprolyl isomerase [Chloroflexia bacterium]|nr:peptidylprolyl isomerase [Chloroflexia bacterium]
MAQICSACQTANADDAAVCANCGAALPGAPTGEAPAVTTFRPADRPGPAGTPSTAGTPGPVARRPAASGAVIEAARRRAAAEKAAAAAAAEKAAPASRPGARGETRPAGARPGVRMAPRGVAAPINNALDRAGLPRFSTQRYLVIWAGFAVVLLLTIGALFLLGANNARQAIRLTPTPQAGAVLTGTVVTVETSKGTFKLALRGDDPTVKNTITNFRVKVASGFYDGKVFHRVEDWVVQGGAPNCGPGGIAGCAAGGGTIAGEYNDKPFARGTLGMAAISARALQVNDSQWFVTKKDTPSLTNNFPNFGTVTEGMDVVDKLVGCTPKPGGAANDVDCSAADKIVKATLGTQ